MHSGKSWKIILKQQSTQNITVNTLSFWVEWKWPVKEKGPDQNFFIEKEYIYFKTKNRKLAFLINHLFNLEFDFDTSSLSLKELLLLNQRLYHTSCQSKEKELENILMRILEQDEDIPCSVNLLPDTLQRLAHKKTSDLWTLYEADWGRESMAARDLFSFERKLNNLSHIAQKRFTS